MGRAVTPAREALGGKVNSECTNEAGEGLTAVAVARYQLGACRSQRHDVLQCIQEPGLLRRKQSGQR